MNYNIFIYCTLGVLFVFFIFINVLKNKRNLIMHINIKKELEKNKYYIKKIGFVNIVTNIFIIVVLFILFIQMYIYNGIQIFNYRLSVCLYGILFLCFIGVLLLKKINLNKKILKIAKKYGLDINKKIVKLVYNFSEIFYFYLCVLFVVNTLILNYINEGIDVLKRNALMVLFYGIICLCIKLIFKTIRSVKTSGDWFKYIKIILRLFTKKPKFIYLGEKPVEPSIHLCNHVGSKGPLRLELYYDHKFNFWGTHEMNDGVKSIYKYLSTIYFQNKKHFKPFVAKVIAFIATPFLKIIYLGLNLIPTYSDMRLKNTLRLSLQQIENNRSIIIFPENSSNGYFDEIKEFEPGFVLLLEKIWKKGVDLPVYVMYYQKKNNRYIIDKKVMISDLLKHNLTKELLAEKMKNRCNELSKI